MTTTDPIDTEHRALREACGLLERSWVSCLEIEGPDRARFLNGYITCDVGSLEPGAGTYGFVTQVKGRILGDVEVLALEDRFWLELPAGKSEDIAAHLGKYAVFDQVEIRALEGWIPLALIGPRAGEVLGEIDKPEATHGHCPVELCGVAVRLVRGIGYGVPAWTVWSPSGEVEGLREKLLAASPALSPVGPQAWERLRVESGRPLCGRDYGIDNFPQETGFEDAVSYTKGCYLGQEVVARIHYRGGVKKLLRGLRFAGAEAPLGKAIAYEGRSAGVVTSAVRSPAYGHIGLSILAKRVEPGTRVELEGGGTAQAVELPFEPLGY